LGASGLGNTFTSAGADAGFVSVDGVLTAYLIYNASGVSAYEQSMSQGFQPQSFMSALFSGFSFGANNSKPSKTACFLRGAAVGAGGALVVGGLAVGAVALGAPAAAVTGVLLVAGGIGGASTLYSAGTNIANGNYTGAAYDVGTLGGGVAAGGLMGVVGDSINPPASRGWSFGRDLANRYNPALGSVGSWLGTGPDAAAAGGSTGASGSGLGRFLSFL